MATFSLYDSAIEPMVPEEPAISATITDVDYKHNIVTTDTQKLTDILTRISGSSYTVDYYSQVLGKNTELRDYDPSQNSIYQQYLYIEKYELKLQSSLSQAFNSQNQLGKITGSAITYPYLKPNKGDAFIGDIGDGRAGQFTVTNVETKSMFKQTCYEIEFELARVVDANLMKNITDKVVKVTHFVRDNLLNGTNPLLTTDEYTLRERILDGIKDNTNSYLNEFYSIEYKTLIVPNGGMATYDPFLTRFVTNIFDSYEYPLVRNIQLYNCDDYRFNTYIDVYRAIIEREIYLVTENAFSHIQVVPRELFNRNFMLQSVYFSRLDAIILPLSGRYGIDDDLGIGTINFGGEFEPDRTAQPGVNIGEDFSGTNNYIFSQAFYQSPTGAVGEVESIVKTYLNNNAVDATAVLALLTKKKTWSRLQRFYYTPILIAILNSVSRSYL